MAGQGLCCGNLQQSKALMKMGLTIILLGHVNFMLAALVHGVVLRDINFKKHQRALEYAISTVVALTSGLLGIIVGILTIVLAKNKKSRGLAWSLFVFSLVAAVLAGASAIGLTSAVVIAIKHRGRNLLSQCRFPDFIGYSSVTNECPFDPTRIYSTTLILWLPLIVTSLVQLVFYSRCFSVCISFLGLPCCPHKKGPTSYARAINVVKPIVADPPLFAPPHTSTLISPTNPPPPRRPSNTLSHHSAPPERYTDSPTRYSDTRSHYSEPTRTHYHPSRPHRGSSQQQSFRPPPPQYIPRQHNSLPQSERQPVPKPRRERSHQQSTRTGTQQRPAEELRLLNRAPLERCTSERESFWI